MHCTLWDLPPAARDARELSNRECGTTGVCTRGRGLCGGENARARGLTSEGDAPLLRGLDCGESVARGLASGLWAGGLLTGGVGCAERRGLSRGSGGALEEDCEGASVHVLSCAEVSLALRCELIHCAPCGDADGCTEARAPISARVEPLDGECAAVHPCTARLLSAGCERV
jgi:hypothetical protein